MICEAWLSKQQVVTPRCPPQLTSTLARECIHRFHWGHGPDFASKDDNTLGVWLSTRVDGVGGFADGLLEVRGTPPRPELTAVGRGSLVATAEPVGARGGATRCRTSSFLPSSFLSPSTPGFTIRADTERGVASATALGGLLLSPYTLEAT